VLVGLQACGERTLCRQKQAASHTVVSKDGFGSTRDELGGSGGRVPRLQQLVAR